MEDAHKAAAKALQELQIEEHKRLTPAMEREVNKRVQKLLERDSEPVEPDLYKEPVMYYEPAEGTGGLPAIICTCGQQKRHLRRKVLQRWAEKHTDRTGHKPIPYKKDNEHGL
jgi:hypothetical protein